MPCQNGTVARAVTPDGKAVDWLGHVTDAAYRDTELARVGSVERQRDGTRDISHAPRAAALAVPTQIRMGKSAEVVPTKMRIPYVAD